jgi:hypothetical protein
MTITSEYVVFECAECLARSARPAGGKSHSQPPVALMGGRIEYRQGKRGPHHTHTPPECELGTPNVNPSSAASSVDLPHLHLHPKSQMSGSEVFVGKFNIVSKTPVPSHKRTICQRKFLTSTVLVGDLTPRVIKTTVVWRHSQQL